MRQYRSSGWILITLIVISGCALINPGENNVHSPVVEQFGNHTLVTPTLAIPHTFTPSPTSAVSPYPSSTMLSNIIPADLQTEIPSSEASRATATEQPICPTRLPPGSITLLHEGSIIFSYSGVGASSGVWAISTNNSIPTLVSNSLSDYLFGAVLSSDGTSLAYIDYQVNPNMLILYDLRTGQLINTPKQEDWRIIKDWLPNGRLKILTDLEIIEMVGMKYWYDLFDPVTAATEEITEVYELPEFQFIPNRWWDGYASIDPLGALVLYTANINHMTDIVLIDVNANEEIWRYIGSSFMGNIPIASWSSDSRMVTFVIADDANAHNNIMNLQIESLDLTEIASAGGVVRRLSWSSDNRYLHYSIFTHNWNEGPGYLVDANTLTQQELCATGYILDVITV